MPTNQITVVDSVSLLGGVDIISPGQQGRPGAVQSISITSDGSITVTGAIADLDNPDGEFELSLPDIATAGTYRSVTVNAKGQFTSGTNPTTLAGYGIADAQPLDADLTALAALSSTGISVRTASNTWAQRSIASSGAGLSVSNGDGVSGNPTISLTNDAAALEALSSTGFAVRTTTDTWTQRSIAVSGTGLSISNADGVSGNPTVTSNATSANTASTIVARDASGNFSAGAISITSFASTGSSNLNISAGTPISFGLQVTATEGLYLTANSSGSTSAGMPANSYGLATVAGNAITFASGGTLAMSVAPGAITINGSTAVTGNLTATGAIAGSVGTSISAAGSTQGTATTLTKQINVVSTVGSGQGVVLPSLIGAMFIVQNLGANALSVYPPSGAAIDSLSTNAAFSLPVGAKVMFYQTSSTLYGTLNATYG